MKRAKTLQSKSEKEIYDYVESNFVKVDKQPGVINWYGKKRHCWLYVTGAINPQIFSNSAYVAFYHWWVYKKENGLPEEEKVETERLKRVRKIKRGNGEQLTIRHRCNNGACCNPKHMTLGTPTDQEIDKHYHYFLHNNKVDKESFVSSMPDDDERLYVKKKRLW